MRTFLYSFVLAIAATALVVAKPAQAMGCGGSGGGGSGGFAPHPFHPAIHSQHYPPQLHAVPERFEHQQPPQFQRFQPQQEPQQFQQRQPASVFPAQRNAGLMPTFSRPAPSSNGNFFGTEAAPRSAPAQPTATQSGGLPAPSSQSAFLQRQAPPTHSQPQTQAQSSTRPSQPALAEQPNLQQNASSEAESISALQLLASLQGDNSPGNNSVQASIQDPSPQPATAATRIETQQPSDLPHVGSWKVNLPGDQSIVLNLNADNTFSWDATKGTSSSTFQGDYRLQADRLILVRAIDLQQMAGSWTANETGFTFKLDGATNGGIAFARQ